MRTATVVLPHSADACWRAVTDAKLLLAWVPGLRRATGISGAAALPREILFEFAESRAYTRVYSYDSERREGRWEPQRGKSDAGSGHARFETVAGGTRLEYALEQGDGRSEAERALGSLDVLVAAFAAWMAHR